MDILSRSGDIRDQSLKWSKIDRNFACFCPPQFFGGPPPEFLKSVYKIQSDSDHLAKFQGDRSRELGASVAKQKKTSAAEYKPVRNGGSGRPNDTNKSPVESLFYTSNRALQLLFFDSRSYGHAIYTNSVLAGARSTN